MGVQEIVAAIPTAASGGTPDQDDLRTELVQGVVGFIPDGTSIVGGVLQVDPADAALGGVRQAYVYGLDAGVFVYDSTDSTTAMDEIFCIVLIGGRRYKRVDMPNVGSVKSRTVTAPPGSPSFGDAYLFLTGTWGTVGGSANQIGIYSSLGGGSWQWIDAAFGPPLYIEDEDGYVHWAGGSGWVDGVGANAYPAATIPPAALIWDERVENQTTTAPPATWSQNENYVIGPSATDDWAGQDGKVAIALAAGVLVNGDTFYIKTPFAGMRVFDKALGYWIQYTGSAWVSAGGNIIGFATTTLDSVLTSGSGLTSEGSGAYSFGTTAPTTSASRFTDDTTLDFQAKSSTSKLRFHLTAHIKYNTGSTWAGTNNETCWMIFRDGETNAIAWGIVHPRFPAIAASGTQRVALDQAIVLDAPDAGNHTYEVAYTWLNNGGNNFFTVNQIDKRQYSIEEIAP